ncbi:MAG: DNA adenine methylase [bacterium]|nr:DNA adenine methylase [bacterium]
MVTLDAYRAAVRDALNDRLLTPWQAAAVVTSLLSAASNAAFTAGKHFAQPFRLDFQLKSAFHGQRIVDDRSVDIASHAADYLSQIVACARYGREGHEVIEGPIESIDAATLASRDVRLVYADPPYTAQQYSRFYHVLDTYSRGRPQTLQKVKGKTTSGLYPVGRYMSPFCRKTQAVTALHHLVQACRGAETTLLLSYSLSAKTSNGNERMLGIRVLTDILSEHYGSSAINVAELDHQYRQFNHGSNARASRSDTEILISAHAA